jgi:MYXO-CTERM domain-containing protein
MRITFWLTLWAGLLAPIVQAGTVQFEVTNEGSGNYQYTYLLSGFTFQANDDLDVQFNPTIYATLTSAAVPDPTQFMPIGDPVNVPPGGTGDYIALALVNNANEAGAFTVDFTLEGGAQPGPQPYSINETEAGFVVDTLATGTTIAETAPEPGSLILGGVGLLLLAGAAFARRRSGHTA